MVVEGQVLNPVQSRCIPNLVNFHKVSMRLHEDAYEATWRYIWCYVKIHLSLHGSVLMQTMPCLSRVPVWEKEQRWQRKSKKVLLRKKKRNWRNTRSRRNRKKRKSADICHGSNSLEIRSECFHDSGEAILLLAEFGLIMPDIVYKWINAIVNFSHHTSLLSSEDSKRKVYILEKKKERKTKLEWIYNFFNFFIEKKKKDL